LLKVGKHWFLGLSVFLQIGEPAIPGDQLNVTDDNSDKVLDTRGKIAQITIPV
jgi:hypothetical protein